MGQHDKIRGSGDPFLLGLDRGKPTNGKVASKKATETATTEEDDPFLLGLKKKESATVSEVGVTPSPTGTEDIAPSASTLPLDIKGIFEFGKQRNKTAAMPVDLPRAISEVKKKVFYGDIKPEELSALYNKGDGKLVVENIIKQTIPEIDEQAIGSSASLEATAKKINETNRVNFVNAEKEGVNVLDTRINSAISNLKSPTKQDAGQVTGYINELRNELNPDDYTDNNKLSSLISKVKKIQDVEQRNYLGGEARSEGIEATTSLLNELNNRLYYNISKQGITPTLNQLDSQINHAVVTKVMDAERGTGNADVKTDNEKTNHFKLGMTAIEKTDPVLFKNVLNGIAELKKVADSDFTVISRIGQEIANTMKFRGGAYEPTLIGTETDFDYSTFGQKVADASGKIGEWAKGKGYKNTNAFPERIIRQGAKETGVDNPEVVNTLVLNEKNGLYDAIPKSGWVDDVVSGIMQPLVGINSTLNSWSESPAETYQRSKAYDATVGSQKVSDEKGEFSDVLPSERGRFTTDMFRGLGQFIPQVLLTKGVGASVKGLTALAGVPLSAGKARNLSDLTGTAISTFMQSYGPSYEEHLQKTGDADTAALIGTIDGVVSAGFETFILPDVKIADRAFRGLRQGLSNDLIGLVKKGGDPAELAKQARPYVQKFFTNATGILTQENLEELGTQYVDFVTESIFDPASAKDRNLNKELWDTFKSTSAAMILPSILGAGGQSVPKDFTVKNLHSSAINLDSYKESLQNSLDKGYIDQNDFNGAVKILSTHRKSIADTPKENIIGEKLSTQQELDYAYEDTKAKVYREKAKASEGVTKKYWETKLKDAELVQQEILMPEEKEAEKQKIFTDFDDTVFKDGKLTPLGKELKAKVKAGEDITVLTARDATPENISFIAKQLGISEDKIKAGLSPEGKASALTPGSVFYNENEVELNAARNVQGVDVVDVKEDQNLLTSLKEKAADTEQGNDMQYFVDKAGEAPSQYIEKYGQEVTDKLLEQVPTEKLKQNLDDLLNINPENPNVAILDKLIEKREPTPIQSPKDTAQEGEGVEGEKPAAGEGVVPSGLKDERTYIHETDADSFDKFDMGKVGSGQGDAWLGRGIYLQEKGTVKLESYGKNKVEAVLKPNAKIFEMEDTPDGEYRNNFVEWAVKNGIASDLVAGRLKDELSLKNLLPRDIFKRHPEVVDKLREEGYDGVNQDGELVIYNEDALQIKPNQQTTPTKGEETIKDEEAKTTKVPLPSETKSADTGTTDKTGETTEKEKPKPPTRKELSDELAKIMAEPLALQGDANPKNRISFKDLGISESDTLEQTIDKLIAYNGEFTQIFKAIKADGNLKNVQLELVDKRSGLENGEAGLYYPVGYGEGKDGLLKIANKDNAYYTAAHELLHFFTLDSQTANETKNTPSYKALIDMYNYIADKKGKPVAIAGGATLENYGLTNEKEFMAEMLINPTFRKYVGDVFVANKEDILKGSKTLRDSKVTGIGDIIYNFFKDLFDKIFSNNNSDVPYNEKFSVVDNAAKVAVDLFFGGYDFISSQTVGGRGATVISMPSTVDLKSAALALPSTNNNDKINSFIKSALEKGASEEDIKGALMDRGFSEEDAQEFIDSTKPQKPKIRVVVGKDDKSKEGDIIDDYRMTTSGDVNKFLSGETIEDVFGEVAEGEQQYDVQKLTDMLQDGLNMINLAANKWGNDVMDYGKPLFEHIQSMSNDANLTNKKAVLLATFLGQLKEAMLREPSRRGEMQPLYNAVEGYYQRYMNIRGKEVVAGRLLRLYRDKYIGDLFTQRILDEKLSKIRQSILQAEQNKKIDDETAAATKKITKEEKDTQDQADKNNSKKAKDSQSKKAKLSTDEAKKKANQKIEEIKAKNGDKKGLIDRINDAIKKLNCK